MTPTVTKERLRSVGKPRAHGLAAQRRFVDGNKDRLATLDLLMAESFVSGIREIGYKSTAHALDELIDNAHQAAASNVHIAFGFTGTSQAKPSELAVVDDGHGMDPAMLRIAMTWGGTHREGDRNGFGRFGFGLPCASLAIARTYTVYSWTSDGNGVYACTFDIDELQEGKYRHQGGRVRVPRAKRAKLPEWIAEYVDRSFPQGFPSSGTVVQLRKLDRLGWKTAKALRDRLSGHIGVVYRNFLTSISIFVDGNRLAPIDPLFLTPTALLYAGDAEELPVAQFEYRHPESASQSSIITIRYCYLPPAQFSERYGPEEKRELNRERQVLRDTHNGLLLLRNGRQIDVVRALPRTADWQRSFKNYHAFFKIEIDFPASLDEEFAVTTSKQQVVLSDGVWEFLREAGVPRMMTELYNRVHRDLRLLKIAGLASVAQSHGEGASKSRMGPVRDVTASTVMGAAIVEHRLSQCSPSNAESRRLGSAGLETSTDETLLERLEVRVEYRPGESFFRVSHESDKPLLYLNKAHRFYDDVYINSKGSPRVKRGLETLLAVMGEPPAGANVEQQAAHEMVLRRWSRKLNIALDRIDEEI